MITSATDVLNMAQKHLKDRGVTYDKPQGERSMERVVETFNVLADKKLTTEEGWMFMVILKLVRSQQGEFKLDNFEDAAAYCGLMAEAACEGYSTSKESYSWMDNAKLRDPNDGA